MQETGRTIERQFNRPITDEIQAIFDRKATTGERNLIVDTYKHKFEKLLETLPKEKRDNVAIKLQKLGVKIGAYMSEYGARISDVVRNIVLWPMIAATDDFPKDKYYQIELARAKAWGEFARDTTKTATAERMAYRNHFLPSTLAGIVPGGIFGFMSGVTFGAVEGTKYGVMTGGMYGAGIGAAAGAVIGGLTSLGMAIKDRLIGPPVLYYNLFAGTGGSSINISTGNDSAAAAVLPQ